MTRPLTDITNWAWAAGLLIENPAGPIGPPRRSECRRGHKLEGQNVTEYMSGGRLKRECRQCRRTSRKARREAIKNE